jgi:hypothetical protein
MTRTTVPAFLRQLTLTTALVAALGAGADATAASYVFTTIDYPQAVFTDVRGLNNNGQIVGYAFLADQVNFGFVYANGTYTRLPPGPNGAEISAHGINDSGVVVGTTTNGQNNIGFIYRDGAYQLYPRANTNTFFRAIGHDGKVTGYSDFYDANGAYQFSSGFIFDPATGQFTDINVPGFTAVIAQGINDAGVVVGSGQDNPAKAFVRDPATGNLDLFQVAGLSTKARGINRTGVITGFVEQQAQAVATEAFTFVGTPPNFETLVIANMPATVGEGINDGGQVAGLFRDAAGNTHGFMATPAELPTGTTSTGAFMFDVPVEAFTPVFIDPEVAIGYQYEIGRKDPRFATVRLPIGIGDNRYSIVVNGKAFPVTAGQLFDFRANGSPDGVSKFRVTDIELDAALDPTNPYAFPTELTFTQTGRFTGTMTALCLAGDLPPQAGPALRRALTRCIR